MPAPEVTRESGPTRRAVVQPWVGRPPMTGSASTVRSGPRVPPAVTRASLWPAAFSTAAAAFSAFALSTGVVPPDGSRWNVQEAGAFRSTVSSSPAFHTVPSWRGVLSSPSASASAATRSRGTWPSGRYTGAVSGPSGSSPAARKVRPCGTAPYPSSTRGSGSGGPAGEAAAGPPVEEAA